MYVYRFAMNKVAHMTTHEHWTGKAAELMQLP